MKKLLILITLFWAFITVNAEVVTYDRTDEDLRVSDDIVVTYNNKDNILATPSGDENLKIYDFADLLTDSEENLLYKEATEFISQYNMDLVLVTIDDNHTTPREFADDFYDYNFFGINDTHNGVLVLIDMDNREVYISTTGEAILMYNDNRIDSILDDMIYYMKNGAYYNAFDVSINDLSDFAKDGIPEGNQNSYIDENGDYVYVEHNEFPIGIFLIISLIVATIVLIIFIVKNKLVKKAYEADKYIEEDKKTISNLGNIFLTTHTSRIYINTDSDSGGSSSSRGGSSTHSSSSGRSHGGGGRSF